MSILFLVESGAKGKKIASYLPSNYIVLASFGHNYDLKKKELGIDVNNNFKPTYKIVQDKNNLNTVLLLNPKQEEAIYLLTLLSIKKSNFLKAKELISTM